MTNKPRHDILYTYGHLRVSLGGRKEWQLLAYHVSPAAGT
jgi:hypothetical protein